MLRKKHSDEKIADESVQMDTVSVTSSSLVTDLSASDYKCLCSHLPKTIESPCIVALESGIGSSISSFDTHAHIDHSHDLTPTGNLHIRHDCQDLPPVTEEDDSDVLINIINSQKGEIPLLNVLPWRDNNIVINDQNPKSPTDTVEESLTAKIDAIQLCKQWENCSKKHVTVLHDDICTLLNNKNHNNHLPNPWFQSVDNLLPVLSPMCHEKEDISSTLRSEVCFSHNNHQDEECRNSGRRYSIQTTCCRPHICWQHHRPTNIIEEDENKLLSSATERVLEWLKLYNESNENNQDKRTFKEFNFDEQCNE